VSAYRPVQSIEIGSVYQQHTRYFRQKDIEREPRTAFFEDLYEAMEEWLLQGDQLVLGMDANEDVQTGQTSKFARTLGLREVILEKHSHSSPPATYNRNQSRQPIDGIFTSSSIKILAGGYKEFDNACPSDHWALWIDISYANVFGHDTQNIGHAAIRKLKSNDPRLVSKYNGQVKDILIPRGYLSRAQAILKTPKPQWTSQLETEYNIILADSHEVRANIESKLRHLKMGGTSWSPASKYIAILSNYGPWWFAYDRDP
jgi:hypothetical protein